MVEADSNEQQATTGTTSEHDGQHMGDGSRPSDSQPVSPRSTIDQCSFSQRNDNSEPQARQEADWLVDRRNKWSCYRVR